MTGKTRRKAKKISELLLQQRAGSLRRKRSHLWRPGGVVPRLPWQGYLLVSVMTMSWSGKRELWLLPSCLVVGIHRPVGSLGSLIQSLFPGSQACLTPAFHRSDFMLQPGPSGLGRGLWENSLLSRAYQEVQDSFLPQRIQLLSWQFSCLKVLFLVFIWHF